MISRLSDLRAEAEPTGWATELRAIASRAQKTVGLDTSCSLDGILLSTLNSSWTKGYRKVLATFEMDVADGLEDTRVLH